MEAKRNQKQFVFCINQIRYLKDILLSFSIEDYKGIGMPIDHKMNKNNETIVISISPEIFDICHVVHQ
jgi:hypothetical protein